VRSGQNEGMGTRRKSFRSDYLKQIQVTMRYVGLSEGKTLKVGAELKPENYVL
jgi:hypothetical protein